MCHYITHQITYKSTRKHTYKSERYIYDDISHHSSNGREYFDQFSTQQAPSLYKYSNKNNFNQQNQTNEYMREFIFSSVFHLEKDKNHKNEYLDAWRVLGWQNELLRFSLSVHFFSYMLHWMGNSQYQNISYTMYFIGT